MYVWYQDSEVREPWPRSGRSKTTDKSTNVVEVEKRQRTCRPSRIRASCTVKRVSKTKLEVGRPREEVRLSSRDAKSRGRCCWDESA